MVLIVLSHQLIWILHHWINILLLNSHWQESCECNKGFQNEVEFSSGISIMWHGNQKCLVLSEGEVGVLWVSANDALFPKPCLNPEPSKDEHFVDNKLNLFNSSSCGLNSITVVYLQEWLWHQITHKGWYAIKQRNQTIL